MIGVGTSFGTKIEIESARATLILSKRDAAEHAMSRKPAALVCVISTFSDQDIPMLLELRELKANRDADLRFDSRIARDGCTAAVFPGDNLVLTRHDMNMIRHNMHRLTRTAAGLIRSSTKNPYTIQQQLFLLSRPSSTSVLQKQLELMFTSAIARATLNWGFNSAASASLPSLVKHSWYPCRAQTLLGC